MEIPDSNFISRSNVLDNNRLRTRSAKWKSLTWVDRPPLRPHLPCHLLCTHLVDRSKEDGNNQKWNIYCVRKEKKSIDIDENSTVSIDWSSPDLCKYGHLQLVHNKPNQKSVSSALICTKSSIWITKKRASKWVYLIRIASPNMSGLYSYMYLNFEGLDLWISLYYVFEGGRIILQFCLTGIVRTAGGWRGEINESWTQLNRNLPLIPTRAVYIIIDSRVSGNCRPRLSEIKSWTTVINHDSPLKWSELSWIKPKQTGFFRPGHNNETFNWWVQSSNISP